MRCCRTEELGAKPAEWLIVVGNNRRIMGHYRLGWMTNLGLVLIAVMAGVAMLLFYGLLFGGRE